MKNGIPPQLFLANVSQCAENGQTYCTNNDDYPNEYFQRLLKDHEKSKEFSKYFREHGLFYEKRLPTGKVNFKEKLSGISPEHNFVFGGAVGGAVAGAIGGTLGTAVGTAVGAAVGTAVGAAVGDRIFGGSSVDAFDHFDSSNEINIEEEIDLCDSHKEVIYPNTGKTKNGLNLYIFNTNDKKQGIHIERCSNAGQQCDRLNADSLPLGYISKCQMKEIYYELIALSAEGELIIERFPFPVVCQCALLRLRIGNI